MRGSSPGRPATDRGPHFLCPRTRRHPRDLRRTARLRLPPVRTVSGQHLTEPGLVVLDVTAAENTVRAVMDSLQQRWANSGITPVWRAPGEAGVRARVYQEVGVGFFDDRRAFPGCSSIESADCSPCQEAVVPDVIARQVRLGHAEKPSGTA
ncbi:DUF6207 family protein [Streptomyces sp. NPDC097727]|uniref:DUF6207 family protein n=1 Tax=Streptomyces sp. NPDC097727 TaxID=3366092 RepID=UPI00381A92A5